MSSSAEFVSELPAFVLALGCSYPLFWLQSFDPEYRIRVYTQYDIDGPNALEVDERPPVFSAGAAIWATMFGVAYAFSSGRCTIESLLPVGFSTVFGVISIAITAKALFGSAAVGHKRLLIHGPSKLIRPVRWRLLDVMTPIPVNLTVVPITKLIWFPVFGAAAYVFSGFEVSRSQLVVPEYAFLAGVFLLAGRLSTMYVRRNQEPLSARLGADAAPHFRGGVLASIAFICLASFFATTVLLEEVLKGCGATPGHLPSYSVLVAGLASMPLVTMTAAVLGTLGGSLVASQNKS